MAAKVDSSNMRYDLNKVPNGKTVISYFPDLAEHKEFADKKNDMLTRIAIWSTDEGSPFVINERDDYERLIRNICSYIGFTDQVRIEQIVLNRDTVLMAMVNRYFIQCDNLAYVMWKDKFMMFHYIGISLRAPVDMNRLEAEMTKRAKLEIDREKIHASLVQYESQVFANTFTRKIVRKEVAKILQLAEKNAVDKTVV